MSAQDKNSILLRSQINYQRADFDHLAQVLDSSAIGPAYRGALQGLFKRMMNPLRQRLQGVEALVDQREHSQAWSALSDIRAASHQFLEEARTSLGGAAIRNTSLDAPVGDLAQKFAQDLALDAGVSWSPAVIIALEPTYNWPESLVIEDNPADSLVRLSLARCDLWRLPLVAHDYGYWVAKRGNIAGFKQLVQQQAALANSILSDNPPTDEVVSALIPELCALYEARRHAADIAQFREQNRAELENLIKRQIIRTWRLIADAFATYTIGPAYAHALLFLHLDPISPFSEGSAARSRYLPAAARRAAVVFDVLRQMDKATANDAYDNGLYSAELNLMESTWQSALDITGNLQNYLATNASMSAWNVQLYKALETDFGSLTSETTGKWKVATNTLVPILRSGSDEHFTYDLRTVLNAGWWCRARYPDRVSTVAKDCMRLLLAGSDSVTGVLANPVKFESNAERLLISRIDDARRDLERMKALVNSAEIPSADRDAVAGRFYRLLSERDYSLSGAIRLRGMGNPLASSLARIIAEQQSPESDVLREELMDFLAGALMRKQGLDQGVCAVAETLVADCVRRAGVNWASRVVLGSNPLFSTASEIIHYRFPDWDIWTLPLMAHEFGHIVALVTSAFNELMARELLTAAQGHPEAGAWNEGQQTSYAARRGRHFHEFFADSFAVYSHGPAFAYSAILLNFDPVNAYSDRRDHPTHAERFEVILQIMDAMNDMEKADEFDNGPYVPVMQRFQRWWSDSVGEVGARSSEVDQFHKLKAKTWATKIFNLLQKYYRFGVKYQASDFIDAEEKAKQLLDGAADLKDLSPRDLLNIAWASRITYPERVVEIARTIRKAWERSLVRHA